MSNMNMQYTEVLAPISSIVVSSKQARKFFDEKELQSLATNIKHNGLNNPGIARATKDGKFELHAGERRLRALKLIKADHMQLRVFPASVDDKRMRLIALSDNTERKDLTTFETAQAMAELVDDFKMSGQDIAGEMGHNVSYVNRLLAPYAKLHPSIRKMWEEQHEVATVANLGKLVSKFAPEEQVTAWKNLCEFGTFERPADADEDHTDTEIVDKGEKDTDKGKFRVKPAQVLENYSILWKGLKNVSDGDIDHDWVRAALQFLIGKRQSPPTGIELPEEKTKSKKAPPRAVRKTGSLEAE